MLLRLKEDGFPGAATIAEWPSWNLPILQWANRQGAIGGYGHCGVGMAVESSHLPNYEIPTFDSVGTNEAIIDVTHGAVRFLSGCEMAPVQELNGWYHMLNCGFRLAMLGETDFPCFSGERPGMGRSYIKLGRRPRGNSGYNAWVAGIPRGNLYCGDGRSHFLDFTVNGAISGEEVFLGGSAKVAIKSLIAARLEPEVTSETKAICTALYPGWHLEKARIGETRNVTVQLVVNGITVEERELTADGRPRSVQFDAFIDQSSWVALRILPSAHTHPVFILVADKPVRASRRSAQWCRESVDKVWEVKSPFIRDSERPEAARAWDHARKTYDAVIAQCEKA